MNSIIKVENLMIDDYVLVGEELTQVTDIDKYDGINRIWIAGCEDGGCIYEKDIKPIPLTPEILEKNGFLVGYKQGSSTYYHIGWDFYLDLDGGEILLKIRRDCDFTFFGIISCKYVHELQHALKICGIEKKIVL